MTTYFCAACCVAWHPYQTRAGVCVQCGGGTTRTHEPADLDADVRYSAAVKAEADAARSARLHLEFDEFCARRDRRAR